MVADSSADVKNPNESMAVQLNDGRVMLMMRNPGILIANPSPIVQMAAVTEQAGITPRIFSKYPAWPVSCAYRKRKMEKGKNRIVFVSPDSEHLEKNAAPQPHSQTQLR